MYHKHLEAILEIDTKFQFYVVQFHSGKIIILYYAEHVSLIIENNIRGRY